MDFIAILTSVTAKEFGATALLVVVVIAIFTDQLVPGRAHRRELAAANKVAEEHRLASEKKDVAIQRLLDQESALIAGIRIADKFYSDFVPPVDEHTQPRSAVPHVGS